jgi:glycosyltransferase involved in cell wall biosynthesis
VVIPQFGVDPTFFCPHEPGRTERSIFRIGYAGGLLPEKGVDLLIRACSRLYGEWELHIAGEGSERSSLQQLVDRLQVTERVRLHGRLSGRQMPDFYRSLDVFVLPSRSRPNWREQFGRVLVEAMASATPVIGSDSGEIPHVIGAAGLIFPENDEKKLRRHLQCLLDDPLLRRDMGLAGRRHVLENYTMAHIAARTVEAYQKLLARHAHL